MSGGLTFSDDELRRAAESGIKEAVRSTLAGGYGERAERIKKIVDKTMVDSEMVIESAVRNAILVAVGSPDFLAGVRAELLRNIGNKVGGAFQGALMAAGKAMANDPAVVDAIRKAAVDAMTNRPATGA